MEKTMKVELSAVNEDGENRWRELHEEYDGRMLPEQEMDPFCHEAAFMEEKMQVIELFGRKALFFDARVLPKELPQGLYRYELRDDECGEFATIEANVRVNFAGTLLMKEPLDLGEDGYLVLDEDTSPNFLGYDETMEEFLAEEQEEKQNGGIMQ